MFERWKTLENAAHWVYDIREIKLMLVDPWGFPEKPLLTAKQVRNVRYEKENQCLNARQCVRLWNRLTRGDSRRNYCWQRNRYKTGEKSYQENVSIWQGKYRVTDQIIIKINEFQVDPQVYMHVVSRITSYFNPFFLVRCCGPYGKASALLPPLLLVSKEPSQL